MDKQKTLVNQVRSATLSKVLPAMIAACLVITVLTALFIYLQVNRLHSSYISDYEQRHENVIATLEGQVQALAQNDLIINSLIDFSNRDSYLPVLFRSLRPAYLREENNGYSFVFTDFEGEVITGKNSDLFNDARNRYDWISTVLENAEPFSRLSKNGLLIVHPVLYSGSAEGAVALFIPTFSSVMRFVAEDYNVLLFDGESLVYEAHPSRTNTAPNRAELTSSNLVLSSVDTTDDLQLFIAQPYLSAYQDAGWISLFMALGLAIVFGASVLAIGSASNIASNIIERLRSQVASARESSGALKEIRAIDNEPQEISELRDTFNSLMKELLDTTFVKDRVEGVINSLDEMLVVFGLDGGEIISNSAYEKLCTFVHGEQLGRANATIFPEGYIVAEESNDAIELTHTSQHQTAERIISWNRTLYKGNDGELLGIVLAGVDITESVALQQELRLKTQAVDEADTPIIITDASKKGFPITYVNKAFEMKTGYALQEIEGQNCKFLQGKNSSVKAINEISSALKEYRPHTTTLLNYRKDGSEFYNQLSITPIRDKHNSVTHMLGFQVDVTDQENAKEFLEQAKQRAEESAQLKSEFLASMSHEIRTPMNGVLGMLGLLQETSLTKQQEHHVKLAKSSADALLTLINDILDFSKIEAGKLALECIPVDLCALLSEVASSAAYAAEEKGLELALDLNKLEVSQVYGDPGRIRQVLTNLIGNAIKFTNEGYVIISAKSEQTIENRCSLSIDITDSGVGIPDERKKSIFDSFSQVDTSTTREYGGTGLGLTISKQLMTLMDGELSVESEENKGSTFTLFLAPLLQLPSDAIEIPNSNKRAPIAANTESAFPTNRFKNLKLAYFEQSAVSRNAVAAQLRSWGIEVFEQSNQSELLTLLANTSIDALVFSSTSPNGNLGSFIKLVRNGSINPDIKVAMISTLTELQQTYRLDSLDLDTFFAKPATPDNLHQMLLTITAKHDYRAINQKLEDKRAALFHKEMHGKNVLLVEDNPINQILAVTLLEGLGLVVDVAGHGKDALFMLNKKHDYAMIFMDCHMPEMDGYEATRQIRSGACGEAYSTIPIVAMTANALAGDRQACLDAGMSDYLSKPIDTQKLERTTVQWLSYPENLKSAERVHDSGARTEELNEDTALNNSTVTLEQDDRPAWDSEEALKRAVGRPDILCKIIDAYLGDTPTLVDQLEQAADQKDVKGIQFSAHAIKGASLNLSANEVSALAAQIEQHAKQNDLSAAASSVALLVEKSNTLFQALGQYRDKNSA